MSTTTTNFGLTKPDATDNVDVSVINTNYDLIDTKAALKANSSGGGELGTSASATTGGAVGSGATATNGGAIGNGAKELYGGGAAAGQNARSSAGGFAGGWYANAAFSGGAIGSSSYATGGGAIGGGATTSDGAAVGKQAKCLSGNTIIDAIQLGTGTNSTAGSMQVYSTPLLIPDGNGGLVIPPALLIASVGAMTELEKTDFKTALGIS